MSLPRSVLPNTTYMLTRRCLGRRFLLRPDGAINNIFVYCLALAAEKFGVELHAACVMSNHYHLILTDVRGVLPDFTAWLNRQLAMCIKRVRKWDEVVWEPNVACSAIELPGSAEVLDKVAYVLLNPVSAALVRSPERWPGVVTTLRTLRRGTMGAKHPEVWFKSKARESATLSFTTPTCFADQASYHSALESLLASRLARVRARTRQQGRGYLGRTRLRKTPVWERPTTKKQRFGRSPTFSALTRSQWLAAAKQLRAFRAAYRTAYEAWRSGKRDAEFPAGTWWVARYAGAVVAT
jgi:REP element-mobilizing transposase RayT